MHFLIYVITFICAYALGSSNMAYYISKIKKIDVKNQGSKNLGASNATMLLGWSAGILSAVHDIGKAVLAVVLANLIFPEVPLIGAVAGVASVLGHIYPFYLKFRGGKGFASFIGVTVALNWKIGLIILAVAVVVALITNYIVAGTTSMIVFSPIALAVFSHSLLLGIILAIASAVIAYKHRDNYVRIFNGTEFKLSKAFTKKPKYD
ncbi:MAG: glycerol-3-phosphate acyltransferase [Oscillospiraceae bacterium]|nr:glycerol-3-phosphate acyltransferase [Oscillospiraceae bacterium]